jgi:hypothetical protein
VLRLRTFTSVAFFGWVDAMEISNTRQSLDFQLLSSANNFLSTNDNIQQHNDALNQPGLGCGMIRCAVPRGSNTAKWLTAVNRGYATSPLSSSEQNGSANSIPQIDSTAKNEGLDAVHNVATGYSKWSNRERSVPQIVL